MTNKRKIEIIDMILDWFEKNPERFKVVNGDADGICQVTEICVKDSEASVFNEYLMSTTKKRWYSQYYPFFNNYLFKPGNIELRVDYLNRLKNSLTEG